MRGSSSSTCRRDHKASVTLSQKEMITTKRNAARYVQQGYGHADSEALRITADHRPPTRGPRCLDGVMSWVANVLLNVDLFEDPSVVESFTSWLETEAPRSYSAEARGVGFLLPLHEHAEAWGGWKNPECRTWGGALNHASIPDVVKYFAELPWRRPDLAQLLVQDQDQELGAFRLWMLREGRAQQHAPLPEHEEDEFRADCNE